MNKFRFGIVGLGQRGYSVMQNNILKRDDVDVTCVCDSYQDRAERASKAVVDSGRPQPIITTDYKKLLDAKLMDAVFIATSWETHINVAIDFLKAGIPVAMEVGGAKNIEELFELVKVQEKTRTPFMFMENCCYNKDELLATAIVRSGLFGEIVHCSGAYGHDLREEVAHGKEIRHYRLKHYLNENCDNYPTHELGPIAKILNVNRGNRMVSLVSVASKSSGMRAYVDKHKDTINPELIGKDFAQGDIVNTLITLENGETIQLKLDTTLPRSYDREFIVRGTKGLYNMTLNSVFLDGDEEGFDTIQNHMATINNATKYEDRYLPDLWKNLSSEAKATGHGGMDGFLFTAFIHAVRNNIEMPIDVYDAAAWMSISCLSAQSIANGNTPIAIPDFTHGLYKVRPPKDVIELGSC